eukprot:1346164-Rhodomonas_salina.1
MSKISAERNRKKPRQSSSSTSFTISTAAPDCTCRKSVNSASVPSENESSSSNGINASGIMSSHCAWPVLTSHMSFAAAPAPLKRRLCCRAENCFAFRELPSQLRDGSNLCRDHRSFEHAASSPPLAIRAVHSATDGMKMVHRDMGFAAGQRC